MALIEVEIRVRCRCGEELDVYDTDLRNDEYWIITEKCTACSDSAFGTGYEAGTMDAVEKEHA